MAERPFILVIDDDETILDLLDDVLSCDYRVYTLAHPYEIVELIHNRRPDLILTDLGMPVTTGVDVINAVRTIPHFDTIPILVISAFPNLVKMIPEGQVQGFLTKPFDVDTLVKRVSELLSQAASTSQTVS